MKQGTVYAGRVKKAFSKTRAKAPKPRIPESDEPLRRLAVSVFGVRLGDVAGETAVDRMLSRMVDWNEVRVSHPTEIQSALGNLSGPLPELCQRLREVLHSLYQKENALSLDRLRKLGRREARQFLESLSGVDAYAAASVSLWSLGGHAIPVDDRLLKALRDAELVHPEASREEVQAFLERNISANDAKEFCLVMRSFVPEKSSTGRKQRGSSSGKKSKSA